MSNEMIQFKFKRVKGNIPEDSYEFQFPEVHKIEESKTYDLQRAQRVNVFDSSYNFDATSGLKRNGIDDLFKSQEATILEVGCKRYVSGVLDWIVQCDLLLLFEDGTEIYCASNCVRKTYP